MKNKRGLTLVETVVAMFIAAIILLGFLQVCSTSAGMLKRFKYRVRAINIAQAEVEDVTALGYGGINVALFPNITNVVIDEGPTALAGDDVVGVMTTDAKDTTNGPDNGIKVIVEVDWNAPGFSGTEIVETVIYNHQ